MGGVVSQEPELGDDHSEGDRQHQLEPGVPDEHDAAPDQYERRDGQRDPAPVVGVAAVQQPALPDLARQIGVEVLLGGPETR